MWASLVVQWLRLHTSTEGGMVRKCRMPWGVTPPKQNKTLTPVPKESGSCRKQYGKMDQASWFELSYCKFHCDTEAVWALVTVKCKTPIWYFPSWWADWELWMLSWKVRYCELNRTRPEFLIFLLTCHVEQELYPCVYLKISNGGEKVKWDYSDSDVILILHT